MMRWVTAIPLLVFLGACFSNVSEDLDVKTLGVPDKALNVQNNAARSIFGRQESTVAFRLPEAQKSNTVVIFYQSRLEKAGWKTCPPVGISGSWGSFIDATNKDQTEKNMHQYVAYFTRADDFARLVIEQPVLESSGADTTLAQQSVVLRLSRGTGERCPE